MYIFTIHAVSDLQAFWSGQLNLPEGTELPMVGPQRGRNPRDLRLQVRLRRDGGSVVDGATSAVSRNEFYAINEGGALGLPA
jgi:hypothetical protein